MTLSDNADARDATDVLAGIDNLRAFECAPRPMYLLRPDGRVLHANAALLVLVGRSADEVVGRHASDLVSPEMRSAVRERIAAALAGDGVLPELQYTLFTKDGRRLTVASSVLAVRDERGSVTHVIGHLRQCTG
jgi:PAS domain S-box-containing protein